MIEIGLTGNPYSGKKRVASLFRKQGIPVFDADTVLKFILNFRPHVEDPIRSNVGSFVYKNGFLNSDSFTTDSLFDRAIDVVEWELFDTWTKFKLKNPDCDFVIFKSQILFERNWNSKFDQNISVFAPKEERVYRAKLSTNIRVESLWTLLDKGVSDLLKNKESDYIIHNYEGAPNLELQIKNISTKILDSNNLKFSQYCTYCGRSLSSETKCRYCQKNQFREVQSFLY